MREDIKSSLLAVDEARRRLDAHRPYTPDVIARLDKWLVPRFLYTSAALGDQEALSASEVTAFLERQIVSGGHHLDRFLAISRHSVALDMAKERASSGQAIDVAFVQDVHRALFSGAQEGGSALRPGLWKNEPTPPTRRRGHEFAHALPEQVDELLQRLMDGFAERRATQHPVEAVSWFYFHFYMIHPFVRGTGKVARLVTLAALLNHGFPPLFVHPDELGAYMDALTAVDTTVAADKRALLSDDCDLSALMEFVAGHLVRAGGSMLDIVTGRRLSVGSFNTRVDESQEVLMARLLTRKNTSWRLRATVEIRKLHTRVIDVLKQLEVRGQLYRIDLVRKEVVPSHSVNQQLAKLLPTADAGLVGEIELVIQGEPTTKGLRLPRPFRLAVAVTATSLGLQLYQLWDEHGEPEVKHGPMRAAEWPSMTLHSILVASVDTRRQRFEREIDHANATASQRLRRVRADQLMEDAEAEAEVREPTRYTDMDTRTGKRRASPRTERTGQALDGVTPSEPPLSF